MKLLYGLGVAIPLLATIVYFTSSGVENGDGGGDARANNLQAVKGEGNSGHSVRGIDTDQPITLSPDGLSKDTDQPLTFSPDNSSKEFARLGGDRKEIDWKSSKAARRRVVELQVRAIDDPEAVIDYLLNVDRDFAKYALENYLPGAFADQGIPPGTIAKIFSDFASEKLFLEMGSDYGDNNLPAEEMEVYYRALESEISSAHDEAYKSKFLRSWISRDVIEALEFIEENVSEIRAMSMVRDEVLSYLDSWNDPELSSEWTAFLTE